MASLVQEMLSPSMTVSSRSPLATATVPTGSCWRSDVVSGGGVTGKGGVAGGGGMADRGWTLNTATLLYYKKENTILPNSCNRPNDL